MKRFNALSLQQKLWLTISSFLFIAVLFLYVLVVYIYENVYMASVEQNLLKEGMNIAAKYKGGEVDDSFRATVSLFNELSNAEVALVNNPRDLSACLPFEVDHHAIISEAERQLLLSGKTVTKQGYEETFGRHIVGTIIPLLDDHRLIGVLYLYVPLASLEDVLSRIQALVMIGGISFLFIAVFVGRKIVVQLTKPLKHMQQAAERVSQGDFSAQVAVETNDEIGQLAKSFNQMARALAEEDERKKEFLANVSHELRTPLSYVKGYSEAILDGIAKDERKYVKLIHREASRMQRLVRDLLDLARLEGTYPLARTPFSIAQLVEETIEKYEPIVREKGVHLHADVDHELIVFGDPDRIEQVLQNLLDNALRYTHEGGSITVRAGDKQTMCELTVADSGQGMAKDDMERLGERFFRTDRSRSREHGGTGLGIAIVKQIVKLHGGTLRFESELGKGTTVYVYIPLYNEKD